MESARGRKTTVFQKVWNRSAHLQAISEQIRQSNSSSRSRVLAQDRWQQTHRRTFQAQNKFNCRAFKFGPESDDCCSKACVGLSKMVGNRAEAEIRNEESIGMPKMRSGALPAAIQHWLGFLIPKAHPQSPRLFYRWQSSIAISLHLLASRFEPRSPAVHSRLARISRNDDRHDLVRAALSALDRHEHAQPGRAAPRRHQVPRPARRDSAAQRAGAAVRDQRHGRVGGQCAASYHLCRGGHSSQYRVFCVKEFEFFISHFLAHRSLFAGAFRFSNPEPSCVCSVSLHSSDIVIPSPY